MGNIFAGSEIVEIGIQIEKNGYDFYSTLVRQSGNFEARGVFDYLAKEEEKHIAIFQKILSSLKNVYEPPESYPGEYFAYMQALANEYIFTQKDKGKEIAQKITTDKEAVTLGIGLEKDSIVFYAGMKKTVPQDEVKIVDELIAQEQKHLLMLAELKQKM